MINALYGQKFNGYMGICTAIPLRKYDIVDVDVFKVSDTKRRGPRSEVPSLAYRGWTYVRDMDFGPPPKTAWEQSLNRHNEMILVKLHQKNNLDNIVEDTEFVVGNYHM